MGTTTRTDIHVPLTTDPYLKCRYDKCSSGTKHREGSWFHSFLAFHPLLPCSVCSHLVTVGILAVISTVLHAGHAWPRLLRAPWWIRLGSLTALRVFAPPNSQASGFSLFGLYVSPPMTLMSRLHMQDTFGFNSTSTLHVTEW